MADMDGRYQARPRQNLAETRSNAMVDSSAAAHWDEGMLIPVAEINELMLDLLRTLACGQGPGLPRLVGELRPLWHDIDDAALQRLARCPYLLLDAGFASPEHWQRRALDGTVNDGAMPRGYFASTAGIALVRHALVLARYLARSHRLTARVLLGLAPECAERIASRSLKDLEALAELCPPWIAPRWEAQPAVWQQMLQAAREGPETLRRVQTRGLQLMAALW
jgi:hypothetical protein